MKIRLIFIIIPLVLLTLALVGGFILMWRLFALSLLMLLLSYLWTRLSVRGLSGQVKKSAERYQVGDSFSEEITVFNKSQLPKLMVRVEENTNLPGHQNMAAFNLPRQGFRYWSTKVYCQRRGQYEIGALTAKVTDPLGLFPASYNLTKPQGILVYPATLELPFFEPIASRELAYGSSRWPIVSETSPNASHVREYASGDRPNRIHWLTTAHAGKIMVKEFDPDRSYHASKNIWLILDMQQAAQLGESEQSTEEYGITIAASLIKKYLDDKKQVGLIAEGDQPYLFPTESGSEYLEQMLEALALMKATGNVPIDQLILREVERFGVYSAITVITPSVSERLMASLRYVKNRGTLVVAILLDPFSFGGTASTVRAMGNLIASDIQVYFVQRGAKIGKVLDSRVPISHG